MTTVAPLDPWEEAYRDFETPEEELRKFIRRMRGLGIERFDRSARVLEVCCGRGTALTVWRQFGFHHVVGLDLSMPLLRLYDGVAPRIAGDMRALPVQNGSQDVVVIQGGLHHLSSFDDVICSLREANRVLKPDGCVMTVDPGPSPFLTFVHAMSRQRLIRRLSKKMDAFERMYEQEQPTYDAWLQSGDRIVRTFSEHFDRMRVHRRWGKLMIVGRKRLTAAS